MLASWEIKRHDDPGLRWVCASCHLPGAEHPLPWMVCNGAWIDTSWERRLRQDAMRLPRVLRGLFGFGAG